MSSIINVKKTDLSYAGGEFFFVAWSMGHGAWVLPEYSAGLVRLGHFTSLPLVKYQLH